MIREDEVSLKGKESIGLTKKEIDRLMSKSSRRRDLTQRKRW